MRTVYVSGYIVTEPFLDNWVPGSVWNVTYCILLEAIVASFRSKHFTLKSHNFYKLWSLSFFFQLLPSMAKKKKDSFSFRSPHLWFQTCFLCLSQKHKSDIYSESPKNNSLCQHESICVNFVLNKWPSLVQYLHFLLSPH